MRCNSRLSPIGILATRVVHAAITINTAVAGKQTRTRAGSEARIKHHIASVPMGVFLHIAPTVQGSAWTTCGTGRNARWGIRSRFEEIYIAVPDIELSRCKLVC